MSFRTSVATAAAVVLLAAACGDSGGGDDTVAVPTTTATLPTTSGPPTVLAIVSPATGDVIQGNVVRLDVTSSGITIVPADGAVGGRTGHYHVFVDRDPVDTGAVIPVAADIVHTTDDPIVIPGLPVGPHRVSVVYGDGTHRRIGRNEAATSFTVAGPSIQVSTPPNPAAGPPVVLQVQPEGLAVPGDGLYYVLVDRDAPPAGQTIPDEPGVVQSAETTVVVSDLAPGTHTLWVVAGTPDRVPLDPPVMDRVVVTVAMVVSSPGGG